MCNAERTESRLRVHMCVAVSDQVDGERVALGASASGQTTQKGPTGRSGCPCQDKLLL